MQPESLTHSRMQSAKDCLRRHYLQYEFAGVGLKPVRESESLRFGTVVHDGLDRLAKGQTTDEVCGVIRDRYSEIPPWCETDTDEAEWFMECEKAVRLLLGYVWRWGEDRHTVLATEQSYDIALVNPATGHDSKNWTLRGRIDKVIRIGTRVLLMEHKTTGESIDPESDYWRRLRIDSQISLYMLASRAVGYPAEDVLYDVIAKPKTSLRNPLYQMSKADKELMDQGFYFGEQFDLHTLGKAVEAKKETPEMYGARLASDIAGDPDRYYARQEIPRLDSDLDELRRELWGIQKRLTFCKANNFWDKNTSACQRPWKCEMCEICYGGYDVSQGAPIPPGYVVKSRQHEELEEINANPTETTTPATVEAPASA